MDLQPRLFVSGTMTFVLAFVVKLLASKFANVFENLPCVLCFLLTCAVTLDELGEEHCPKAGKSPAQARVPLRWGTVPFTAWLCISPGLGECSQPDHAVCSTWQKSQWIENLYSVLRVNLFKFYQALRSGRYRNTPNYSHLLRFLVDYLIESCPSSVFLALVLAFRYVNVTCFASACK